MKNGLLVPGQKRNFPAAFYKPKPDRFARDIHIIDASALEPAVRGAFGFSWKASDYWNLLKQRYTPQTIREVEQTWNTTTFNLERAVQERRILRTPLLHTEYSAIQAHSNANTILPEMILFDRASIVSRAKPYGMSGTYRLLGGMLTEFVRKTKATKKPSTVDVALFSATLAYAHEYPFQHVHVYTRDTDIHSLFDNAQHFISRLRRFDDKDLLERISLHDNLQAETTIIPYDAVRYANMKTPHLATSDDLKNI